MCSPVSRTTREDCRRRPYTRGRNVESGEDEDVAMEQKAREAALRSEGFGSPKRSATGWRREGGRKGWRGAWY
jgi:hypothetical protein